MHAFTIYDPQVAARLTRAIAAAIERAGSAGRDVLRVDETIEALTRVLCVAASADVRFDCPVALERFSGELGERVHDSVAEMRANPILDFNKFGPT